MSGICASLASDHQHFQKRLKRKSCFILATNQIDTNVMSGHQMLADYKNQQKVERGFRFLKGNYSPPTTIFIQLSRQRDLNCDEGIVPFIAHGLQVT